MHTVKRKLPVILWMGLLFGAGLAFGYVNPYHGTISLSELTLQLSGSRGDFELGFGIVELLGLDTRLIPAFVFELYVGTALYRYFCTASVYIFSRTPDRLRWYGGEIAAIAALTVVYELALMAGTVLVTALRCQLAWDGPGPALCAYHIALYALWTCALTVLVNLLAIPLGSSAAFVLLAGAQLVLTALLSTLRAFRDDADRIARLIGWNPISHLVLGWHSSQIEALDQAIHSPYGGLSLCGSLLLAAALCAAAVLLGAFLVKRHDLLISNSETGAF